VLGPVIGIHATHCCMFGEVMPGAMSAGVGCSTNALPVKGRYLLASLLTEKIGLPNTTPFHTQTFSVPLLDLLELVSIRLSPFEMSR
jgi:hypothetical protein